MKVSAYEFKNLSKSYGIVEFEANEYNKIISSVNMFEEKLKDILECVLGSLKCFKYAKGFMIYGGKHYSLIYLGFETEDNAIFAFELYPNSMSVESNTNIGELLKVIDLTVKTLMKEKSKS